MMYGVCFVGGPGAGPGPQGSTPTGPEAGGATPGQPGTPGAGPEAPKEKECKEVPTDKIKVLPGPEPKVVIEDLPKDTPAELVVKPKDDKTLPGVKVTGQSSPEEKPSEEPKKPVLYYGLAYRHTSSRKVSRVEVNFFAVQPYISLRNSYLCVTFPEKRR